MILHQSLLFSAIPLNEESLGTGTKHCMAILTFALVGIFYLLRTFIIWSIKAQAFKAHQL